jgi:hypothetical protein
VDGAEARAPVLRDDLGAARRTDERKVPRYFTYEFDSDGTAVCNANHLANNSRPLPGGAMAFRRTNGVAAAELRIPHADTLLPAVPGYVFQLNVRFNHYSPGGKQGRSIWRPTAFRARRPDRNVVGWGKMRLVGNSNHGVPDD